MKSLVALTTFVLILWGAVFWRKNTFFPEFADPTSDAKRAIATRDFRFQAVAGYSAITPGIPNGLDNPLAIKYGYQIIRGTSDMQIGFREMNYNRRAYDYAVRYNHLLMQHLKATPKVLPKTRTNSPFLKIAKRSHTSF